MHLKVHRRHKDGKEHRYFSIVESRRGARQRVVHRMLVYLGEINDSRQAAWRKTLEVFDEREREFATLSLFPDDRDIAADVDALQIKLGAMQLERSRTFGSCRLGCELWRQLRLDRFWQSKLPAGREAVPWEKVLQLLVVNRLLDPGSEFRVHRQWFDQTAIAELLGTDFAVAEKDRLYRCLDRLLEHKQELFQHLRQRGQELFAITRDAAAGDRRARCVGVGFLLAVLGFRVDTATCACSDDRSFRNGGRYRALWLRGINLNVPASIGFIAVFRVAILDGVVLVSTTNKLLQKGRAVKKAVLEAASMRLRPVAMTSVVAGLGFLPMAIATTLEPRCNAPWRQSSSAVSFPPRL